MKKCVLAVALLVAALSWSCSQKQEEAKTENDFKSKIENCTNPDSLALYVQEAAEYAQKLASEGKGEEAQSFIDELAPVVAAKDSASQSVWAVIVETVQLSGQNVVDSAKTVAGDAVDSAKAVVSDAKEAVADKVSDAVETAKEGVSNAAEKAADKVEDAAKKGAEAVKQTATDAAKKGAEEVSKLGNKFKK